MPTLLYKSLHNRANDAHLKLPSREYCTPDREYYTLNSTLCIAHSSRCAKPCTGTVLFVLQWYISLSWTQAAGEAENLTDCVDFDQQPHCCYLLAHWRKVSFCRRFVKSNLQRNHKCGAHEESLEANDNNGKRDGGSSVQSSIKAEHSQYEEVSGFKQFAKYYELVWWFDSKHRDSKSGVGNSHKWNLTGS